MNSPNRIIDDTLKRKRDQNDAKFALAWAALNVAGALVIYWDMCYSFVAIHYGLPENIVWYSELAIIVILILNALVDIITYCKSSLLTTSIELTPRQRKLLGINDSDVGFTIKTKPTPSSERTTPNSKASFMTSTPHAVPHTNWIINTSQGSPVSKSTSWMYYPTDSPLHRKESPSFLSSSDRHSSFLSDPTDLRGSQMRNMSMSSSFNQGNITDEESLSKYLESYELQTLKTKLAMSEMPQSLGTSFWSLGHKLLDYTPLLRKYAYQIASRSSQSTASFTDNDLGSLTHHTGEEIWSKLGVPTEQLYGWMKNLRQWLNLTILERVINEFRVINETLRHMGSPDLQVGEVNLSTLRQVALVKSQLIPTLNQVLLYLEVTTNQEYLVQRMQELSTGGCMSEFKWNGGGKFKGKPWGDHLPTDSAIIMHLFCTYLDSRLPPHPNHPDGRTFTNQYFVKTPDKPDPSKVPLCFYQTKISPPHYKLVVKDEVWDVPKGHNNLFHTMLLFLYYVKEKENGSFGRINFGPSGINALWIVK